MRAAGGRLPTWDAVVVPPPRWMCGGDGSAALPQSIPAPGSEHDEQILSVLHMAVRKSSGGVVFPNRLQRHLWMALRDLLPLRTLKSYIQSHSAEFDVLQEAGQRPWAFTPRVQ